MKCLAFALFFLSCSLFSQENLLSCQKLQSGEKICAAITSDVKFPVRKMTSFTLNLFHEKNAEPVILHHVYLWMIMNPIENSHGSKPLVWDKTEGKVSPYKIDGAFFLMPGKWEIKVEAFYKDEKIKIIIPLEIKA